MWRVRAAGAGGGWTYVLVLLEFQSDSDATMAFRVLEYTAMLYRELLRARAAEVGRLPPVLPVVLYNGESRWSAARDMGELIAAPKSLTAYQPSQRYMLLDERHAEADYAGELTQAVTLLERSESPADLARLAGRLVGLLNAPGREELRRTFADWLWVLYERLRGEDEPAAAQASSPELMLEEVRMTLEERVARWPEQWIRQGIEQGVEQGLARQRKLLRHLVEERFGTQTAERLLASLRREDDPQRLDAICVAVVRCETGDELLRQAVPGA